MPQISYHLSLLGVVTSPEAWAALVRALHALPTSNIFQTIPDAEGMPKRWSVGSATPPAPGPVDITCTLYAPRMDMDTPHKPLERTLRSLGLGYVWAWEDSESDSGLSWAQVRPRWDKDSVLLTLDQQGPLLRLSEARDPEALASIEQAWGICKRVTKGALFYAGSAHQAVAMQAALAGAGLATAVPAPLRVG